MKLFLWAMLASAGLLLASCCCPEEDGHANALAEQQEKQPSVERVWPARCATEEDYVDIAGQAPGQGQNPLHVVPRQQEGLLSCWSTCAEMIMAFHGRNVSQCQQAGPTCCLGGATPYLDPIPSCDRAGDPDFPQWHFLATHYGATAANLFSPGTQGLPWGTAIGEIQAGRPFAFSWVQVDPNVPGDPNNQIGHMMTVIGYTAAAGQQTLTVLNPRARACTDVMMVPFSDYYGSAACIHRDDYFMIMPNPQYTGP